MIGYVTLGTSDMERAGKFYDQLLGELGATRFMDDEKFIAWTASPAGSALSICPPFDGNAPTVGNGVMIALAMDSREKVDAFYNKAIELGAKDEGAPGPRGDNFYAGYFRDLDGNKLNAYFMG
jgi:predicted lactoylglutathione lyase